MRFSPAAIALSLTLAVMSSASIGARADDDIDARSIALTQTGNQEAKAGRFDSAINWYESALAVDPRNRAAYIAMARAVKAQGLNGKAIRFYKEALELEPNDQIALAEQADVMIAKGAVEQAGKNIARLKTLCRTSCAAADRLSIAASNATEKQQMQASAVELK
ncbi:MAG: tetratricopeptide repeat protein, partial [Sphingorhabdus sp.]